MRPAETKSLKLLIVHGDPTVSRDLETALRRSVPRSCAVFHGALAGEAMTAARSFDPEWVWLDLDEEPGLALEVVAELRKDGRKIVGLYNPLVAGESHSDFLRRAIRAGVCDFLPLPPSDTEIQAIFGTQIEPERHADSSDKLEPRLVSLIGAKGGVGTSTLSLALGQALAETVADAVLVDAVPRFGVVAQLAGAVADQDLLDLVQDLDDLVALPAYLIPVPGPGLRLLAGPHDPVAAEALSPAHLSRALIELKRRYSRVIVDVGSCFDALALAAIDLSETVVVVVEGTRPGVLAAHQLLELLSKLGVAEHRLRVGLGCQDRSYGRYTPALCAQHLGRPLDFVIPYDKQIAQAADRGEPLMLSLGKGTYSGAVRDLASAVNGEPDVERAPLALANRGFR